MSVESVFYSGELSEVRRTRGMVCFQDPVRISGVCNVLSVPNHADMASYLLQLWRPGEALYIHARLGCHVYQFEDVGLGLL